MVPVTVEGVRRNFGISSVFMYTATLVEASNRHIYTVIVERHEALAIVAALHNLALPRPQTVNLPASTLTFHGITLDEMHLARFSQSPIYLATVTLRWRDSHQRAMEQPLDLRPGDAIALALLMHCPLLLTDELARQASTPLAEGETPELCQINALLKREGIVPLEGKHLRLGYSKTPMRNALLKEFKASLLGKAPPFPEENLELRKQELLTFLLGASPRA